jgi:hypothetical protein
MEWKPEDGRRNQAVQMLGCELTPTNYHERPCSFA